MRPPRFSFIIMFLACVSVLSTESARAGLIIDITGTAGAGSIDINFSGTAVTTESIYTGTPNEVVPLTEISQMDSILTVPVASSPMIFALSLLFH